MYLTNCQVIDPSSGKLLDGPQTITLNDGEIAQVGKSGSFGLDGDTPTIDLEGKYICPGLIDAHVHVSAVPGTEVSSPAL